MADEPKGLSLFELNRRFPNEDAAVKHFEAMRWNGATACPSCGSTNVFRLATDRRLPLYQCRGCQYQFTVTAGTVMEHTMAESYVTALSEEESVLDARVRDLERERDGLRINAVELRGWLTMAISAAALMVSVWVALKR